MMSERLRVGILTQDDPFYLPEAIAYLISTLLRNFEIVFISVLPQSISGKRQSFYKKIFSTIRVFGFKFFIKYAISYIIKRLIKRRSIGTVANKYSIPTLKVTGSINDKMNLKSIAHYKPDVLVSIGASQIFKLDLISLPPLGCLNLHTGLLPKYRGLMPTFWAMLNEEKVAGISVFLVDEGIDSGPIVVQKRVEIGEKSQQELIQSTKKLGMQAIIEALYIIQRGNAVLIPNESKYASYFGFPTRSDVLLFLSKGKTF